MFFRWKHAQLFAIFLNDKKKKLKYKSMKIDETALILYKVFDFILWRPTLFKKQTTRKVSGKLSNNDQPQHYTKLQILLIHPISHM